MLHQCSPDFLNLSAQLLQHAHHLAHISRAETLRRRSGPGGGAPREGRRHRGTRGVAGPSTAQRSRCRVDPHAGALGGRPRLLGRLLGRLRQQRRGDVDLAGLLERVLLVGRGHVAGAGGAAAAGPGPARRGAGGGAAEGVEAEGGALGGGAGEGEDLPALVEPDAAGQGRVGRLEEEDADLLGGGVGDDEKEGLEEDDGDEVLSGRSVVHVVRLALRGGFEKVGGGWGKGSCSRMAAESMSACPR